MRISATSSPGPRTKRRPVARSIEALAEESDADAAVFVVRGLVEDHPDIAEGHYGLARLALRSGDYDTVAGALRVGSGDEPRLGGSAPCCTRARCC